MSTMMKTLGGVFAAGAVLLLSALPASAFPDKGKPVSIVVPYPAGGGSDGAARALAPFLAEALGTRVNVVNKGGAGSQVGMTYVANAKPDGYTLGYGLWPTLITIYIDPKRQAAFTRKSFIPVALHMIDPGVIAVKADSPFKNLKDLVAAAKAKPEKVKVSDNGLLNPEHLMWLQFQEAAGVTFAIAHFKGGGPAVAGLLGGHTDAAGGGLKPWVGHLGSGGARLLAVLDDRRNKYFPQYPTAAEQGYDLKTASVRGFVVPAGTPKDVVDTVAKALKQAINSSAHQERLAKIKQEARYLGPDAFSAFWDDMEARIIPRWKEAVKGVAR
jgi:tripartite-type tricarboxylate transporter receptor subunit TctC